MLFKGPLLHKVWDLVVFLCPIGQCWVGWFSFFLFFMLLANVAGVFGVPFPCFVIFWMLYFSSFPKQSCIPCFSEALLLVMSIWGDDVLSFHAVRRFLSEKAEVNSVWTWSDVVFMGLCVSWAVWVFLQYSEDGNGNSSAYQQARSSQWSRLFPPLCLRSVFLFTAFSFDCYSQLAESTFSTCAIQRYFSTSLYSFWCTFVICVLLVWW